MKKLLIITFALFVFSGCALNRNSIDYLVEGRRHLSKSEYTLALEQFNLGIELYPENIEYRLAAADVYLKKGNKAEAKAVLENGYNQENNAELATALAEVYLEEGELEQAATWFDRAIAMNTEFLPAHKGKIKYLALKNDKENINKLLAELDPEDFDSETYLIKALVNFEQPKESAQDIIISATKGDEFQDFSKELRLAYIAYETDPSVHNLSQIVYLALNYGWFEVAQIPVSKVTSENSFYETGYVYQGLISLHTRQIELAKENFDKVLELNPANTDAKIFKIQTLFLLEDRETAVAETESVIAQATELSIQQFTTLVEILYKNDRNDLIDRLFTDQEGIIIPAAERTVLIEALIELEKFNQSEVLSDQALTDVTSLSKPVHARLKALQGYSYFNTNKRQQGLELLTEARGIDSTQSLVHYYYGKAQLENGNVEEARIALEKAIEVDLEGRVSLKAENLLNTP